MIRAIVGILIASAALASTPSDQLIDDAQRRWAAHPHGPLLERTLPPAFPAARIPEPAAEGAQLLVRYCVQCHHLPNPAMHDADKWPKVVSRMVIRMRGEGNLGAVMREMMVGIAAPTPAQAASLVAYLKRHAQRAIDPGRYPDLGTPQAQSFRLACQQCHVLPDPQRYRAREWPAVVARMEQNMAWMNRVVGSSPDPREPQLRLEEINAFLAKHSRK